MPNMPPLIALYWSNPAECYKRAGLFKQTMRNPLFFRSSDRENIIMKFQVVICITFSLLGMALSGPLKIGIQGVDSKYYDGMTQQDSEADDYKSQIQQDYDGQDSEPGDYDVIQQDHDGMIQQGSELGDYDGMIQQDSEPEDYDGMIQQDSTPEEHDETIQQDVAMESQTQFLGRFLKKIRKRIYHLRQFYLKVSDYYLQTAAIPLYRYWKAAGKASNHFYTYNPREIGTIRPGQVGMHGYKFEGVVCRTFAVRVRGSVPLYRYYRGESNDDHLYTTDAKEIGTTTRGETGKHGYRSEGIVGYCFPSPRPKTVPLYRYWNPAIVDHFYTTNINEIGTAVRGRKGKHGYISEGVACYVYQ